MLKFFFAFNIFSPTNVSFFAHVDVVGAITGRNIRPGFKMRYVLVNSDGFCRIPGCLSEIGRIRSKEGISSNYFNYLATWNQLGQKRARAMASAEDVKM